MFQYAGLTDWRSVACRVLDSIGWTAECVFESTLYPQKVGTGKMDWKKINTNVPSQSGRDQTVVEAIIWESVIDGLAIGVTLLRCRSADMMAAVHILGRTIKDSPWAHTGLALAAGLQYLESIQLIAHNRCGPIQRGGRLEIVTDYQPF